MEENIVYFKHFWEHILYKQMFEIEQRYYGRIPMATDLYEELQKVFQNKLVIPFMDFSVATACSLNCRACSQWMPYLKRRKIFSAQEVHRWMEEIFRYIDYIHIISPFGGEAFLNDEFAEILNDLLRYKSEKKIGFIRIVTNGTVFPSESLRKVLCNPDILILVSNYTGGILSAEQSENYKRFIQFLNDENCRYYEAKMEWIDLGIPEQKRELQEQQKHECFSSCFVRDCAGLYEGNLYHCPRIYALENMGLEVSTGDDVIRFAEIKSKEEMREKLERFYCVEALEACAWCSAPEDRHSIPAAEQL